MDCGCIVCSRSRTCHSALLHLATSVYSKSTLVPDSTLVQRSSSTTRCHVILQYYVVVKCGRTREGVWASGTVSRSPHFEKVSEIGIDGMFFFCSGLTRNPLNRHTTPPRTRRRHNEKVRGSAVFGKLADKVHFLIGRISPEHNCGFIVYICEQYFCGNSGEFFLNHKKHVHICIIVCD